MSGFGSGAAFSWISGMTPTPQGIFTSAVLMALTQGAFYKVSPAIWALLSSRSGTRPCG